MKAFFSFIGAAVLLILGAAFAVALWNELPALAAGYRLYLYEGVGLLAYFALRIVLAIFGRNYEFLETFCHELNHTVFAVLSFHKVESFFAHADDGGQVTFYGGTNPVISLAPYSFPLFAFVTALFTRILIPEAQMVAQGLVGFFLMFHLISVLKEARPRQTDLQEYGYFFSYAAILFSNIFFIPGVAKLAVGGFPSAFVWCKTGLVVAWNWGIKLGS
ncbi:MAG: M50 family metallopeptidase [Fibrobacter sp.]|nr:M50 family metallopeptidase [Fibrobacter sp.]